MSIGVIFEGPGVTQEQYSQVFNQIMPTREKPPGLLSHHAGPSENGMCVFKVWESPEALQSIFDEQLGEALEAAGIRIQPRMFEIMNSV